MNDERTIELKTLAKEMVWVQGNLDNERISEFERYEMKEEAERIRMALLNKDYDISMFEQYMEEYKELGLGELNKWLYGEDYGK